MGEEGPRPSSEEIGAEDKERVPKLDNDKKTKVNKFDTGKEGSRAAKRKSDQMKYLEDQENTSALE